MDIEELKLEIVQKLKPLNPKKIILFGSYAYGTPSKDSDIDLYVVTNDEFIPKNYKEKSEIHLKVTKAMHEKFIEMDSMFSRKILKEGIPLI